MNDRIQRLIAAARAGDVYPQQVKVEYDEFDLKLSDPQRIAKRLTEYMAAQPCAFLPKSLRSMRCNSSK